MTRKKWFSASALYIVVIISLITTGYVKSAIVIERSRDYYFPQENAFRGKKAATQYDHGDPTAREQYLLELINRARANPAEEIEILLNSGDQYIDSAIDSFGMSRSQLRSEFTQYDPQPPLALNKKLSQAATRHSRDMAENNFQAHIGSDGSTLADRLDDTGYPYLLAGENIYAYAQNMLHGHAGFLIDWGVPDLGHRNNLLNFDGSSDFEEVGLAVVPEGDPATDVGPWVITQDFARAYESPDHVFVTGVAYRDENDNDMYDIGEGLDGIRVELSRGDYYAVTSGSGGYAVPVELNSGQYEVTAARNDLADKASAVTISEDNVKVDFIYGSNGLGSIKGRIVKTDGEPLAGATVELSVLGRSAVTDSNGEFSFIDLTDGNYTLYAQMSGYTINPNDFVISLTPGKTYEVRLEAEPTGDSSSSDTSDQNDDQQTDDDADADDSAGGGPCGLVLIVLVLVGNFAFSVLKNKS